MRWDELRTRCINACTLYIDKVQDDPHKAKASIIVRAMEKVPNTQNQYVLELEKRVFNLEYSNLVINTNLVSGYSFLEQKQTGKHRYEVKIEVFPDKELAIDYTNYLSNLNVEGWEIRSDMTFLIQRVRHFFQEQHAPLTTPVKRAAVLSTKREKYGLDKWQAAAVTKILAEPLAFVWGPPGSGKTKRVLAAAVDEYVSHGKHILIVTPTNTSLELCLRGLITATELHPEQFFREGLASEDFLKHYPMCCNNRLLSSLKRERNLFEEERCSIETEYKIATQEYEQQNKVYLSLLAKSNKPFLLNRHSVEQQIEEVCYKLDIVQQLKKDCQYKLNAINENIAVLDERILESSYIRETDLSVQVRGCTLDYFIANSVQFQNMDHIFVDEAAYAHAIKVLPLFSLNTPITLLGDVLQLPPIYEFNSWQIREEKADLWLWTIRSIFVKTLLDNNCGFEPNLYRQWEIDAAQYLCSIDMPIAKLYNTYRYGQSLADLLSRIVYEKYGMKIRSKVEGDITIYHLQVPYEYNRTTKTNLFEKIQTQKLADELEVDFMVLTPYRKQRIDGGLTIHRSQGEEYDVVILSLGRIYNEGGHFVDSTKFEGASLLNTAISRAKRALIVVADRHKWANAPSQLVTQLIENAISLDLKELVRIINNNYQTRLVVDDWDNTLFEDIYNDRKGS